MLLSDICLMVKGDDDMATFAPRGEAYLERLALPSWALDTYPLIDKHPHGRNSLRSQ